MQKWEYLEIALHRTYWYANRVRNDSQFTLVELLDELGQEGWELAAAERKRPGAWTEPNFWMLLKRPLP
jgi:hypothetical protein